MFNSGFNSGDNIQILYSCSLLSEEINGHSAATSIVKNEVAELL